MCRISNSNSEIRNPTFLAFRELEALASALLPVFLAFFDTWIASDQTCLLQRRSQVAVVLHQRSRNAVTNCACLSRRTAALNVDQQIKLAGRFRQLQRLTNDHAQRLVGKILFKRLAINFHCAFARAQVDARCRGLSSSGSVVLNISHSYISSSLLTLVCYRVVSV